jgi:hypothetical protein
VKYINNNKYKNNFLLICLIFLYIYIIKYQLLLTLNENNEIAKGKKRRNEIKQSTFIKKLFKAHHHSAALFSHYLFSAFSESYLFV